MTNMENSVSKIRPKFYSPALVLATVQAFGFIVLFLFAPLAKALPIGFGRNQSDLRYSEVSNEDFLVYFDRDTPEEGRFSLAALTEAKPHLERWLGVKRERPLPVILSAVTANASFANFITDALEIQSLGQSGEGGGARALVWHEYTHNMMYRHLDNVFGPPGAILHLPWMPVWFIEGLAEATSVSIGSDFQAGVERFHALTGTWPSYDRMHSLYGSRFSARGYAAAGAFVRWIMESHGSESLPAMLKNFRDLSMPWWWPWAAVPFNGFMPMDDSLKTLTPGVAQSRPPIEEGEEREQMNKSAASSYGRRLYARYIAQASKTHRDSSEGKLISASAKDQGALVMSGGLVSNMRNGIFSNGNTEKSGSWLTEVAAKTLDSVTDQPGTGETGREGKYLNIWRVTRVGRDLVWMEQEKNVTRFCRRSLSPAPGPHTCPLTARFPQSLDWLGSSGPDAAGQTSVFLVRRTHHLTGDQDEILTWRAGSSDVMPATSSVRPRGRPISIVQEGDDLITIESGRDHRWLVRYDARDGTCRSMHRMTDLPVMHEPHPWGSTMAFWVPEGYVAYLFRPGELLQTFTPGPCVPFGLPTSPLLEAVRASARGENLISFNEALNRTRAKSPPTLSQSPKVEVTDGTQAVRQTEPSLEDAKWRPRSVLAFPWIGADDALGPQIGVVSVPLMDHMQNETLRATFLVGVNSRYPNTDLRLISNRFQPTLSAAVFRQQTYNGIMRRAGSGNDDPAEISYDLSYLDEQGLRFDAGTRWDWQESGVDQGIYVEAGVKRSILRPYIGPQRAKSGALTEFTVALTRHTSRAWRNLTMTQTASAKLAPESANDVFDYNSLSGSAGLSLNPGLLNSRLGLGIEGARTRGRSRRELQEVYRPLKTFVPGSGGGLNQNSFPVTGEGWLFAGRYGDSQARVKADWTMPLVADFEKLIWIFYVDRLDFTAFLNYGGAWRGATPPADRLVGAHGYNVDLQLDNKGVRFNLGGGVGQMFQKPWESYLTLGFDALF
jgi:hypothetical protein